MRCLAEGCSKPAVCRYCHDHRPEGLPLDLERPSVGPDAETVDLHPEPQEDSEVFRATF